MSKYSDKVRRREEMARRQIAKPLPAAAPLPTSPRGHDDLTLEARARNLTIVGNIFTSLDLAMGLAVRAASLADNWAKCNRRTERFNAMQTKEACRAAITRLATAFKTISKSDFAPLEATNAPSPFVTTKKPIGMHGEESPSTGRSEATKVA